MFEETSGVEMMAVVQQCLSRIESNLRPQGGVRHQVVVDATRFLGASSPGEDLSAPGVEGLAVGIGCQMPALFQPL